MPKRGYSTAIADDGMSVALIERDATLGRHMSETAAAFLPAHSLPPPTIDTVHRAAKLGVNASVNGIDFGTLRDYRLRVVDTMVGGLSRTVSAP